MNNKIKIICISMVLAAAVNINVSESKGDSWQKGLKHADQGQYEQAIEQFKLALITVGERADIYCALGVTYANMKDYDNARINLEKCIGKDDKFAAAYYILGMVYEKMNMEEEAINVWQRYLELAPEGRKANKVKRHLERLQGRHP